VPQRSLPNGVRLHWREAGVADGPPIVWVHGGSVEDSSMMVADLEPFFDRVRALYGRAYLGVRPVRPPADVADLHARVAASLRGLADDARRARDALRGGDAAALKAALADLRAEGLRLQALAAQLRARGY